MTPSTPTWSLIVPYYNEAAFLPATLASLLNQDFRGYRLILVDNGSTDGSQAVCRRMLEQVAIDVEYAFEARPGKTNALECGLNRVRTEFVAICDADTIYPPHYLARCNELFAEGPPDLAAVMAIDLYSDPRSLSAKLRMIKSICVARILAKQTHTGGFGQSFRTATLRQVGGFSSKIWPYLLEDHEIMQRVFKVGRSRYDLNLWCMPSSRRTDRVSTRWSLLERALYHLLPYRLKDWFFYTFLSRRFARRTFLQTALRERCW